MVTFGCRESLLMSYVRIQDIEPSRYRIAYFKMSISRAMYFLKSKPCPICRNSLTATSVPR